MTSWKSYLKSNPADWLLEEENPSVHFFTMRDILDFPSDSPKLKAKRRIMESGAVPAILARQNEGGYWGKPEDFYVRSKYRGTVWTFILLTELGVDGNDERLKKTCEFILENSQDKVSGGFSYQKGKDGGTPSGVIPCLTGNMLTGLIKCGYLGDPRVKKGIEWITTYQRFDDGKVEIPIDFPYRKTFRCFEKHTCHMGVVKTLKALAEIPMDKRTTEVKTTVEKGVEYLLKHHIYKRSHNLQKVSKPGWLELGFPLMYNTDVLEILEILLKLGVKDPRMQEAIDLVLSKQDSEGRWLMEHTYNGRFQVSIEPEGKPSKWVTLKAMKVIKGFYSG